MSYAMAFNIHVYQTGHVHTSDKQQSLYDCCKLKVKLLLAHHASQNNALYSLSSNPEFGPQNMELHLVGNVTTDCHVNIQDTHVTQWV